MLRWNAKLTLSLVSALSTMILVSEVSAQALLRGTKSKYPVDSRQTVKPAATNANKSKSAPVRKKATNTTPTKSSMNFAEAVALQAALDRAGYSPGIIDGLVGRKTASAIRAFQTAKGLSVTGTLDKATRLALGVDAAPATTPYRLTEEDRKQVSECPTDWIAKSKAKQLGFESLVSVAAFHGHCTRKLVERLNVGKNLDTLKPGDVVVIPHAVNIKPVGDAARIEVDFASKMVKAFDASNKLIGLFHCSIAKETRNRPEGPCKVATISKNPNYTFKPESWPEVKGVDRNLEIPPGARNPVGLCWIGLDKKGYGIHGTPEPELIGKTGSHGCIRLTNWDVLRLAEMVKVGTDVKFVDTGASTFATVR